MLMVFFVIIQLAIGCFWGVFNFLVIVISKECPSDDKLSRINFETEKVEQDADKFKSLLS